MTTGTPKNEPFTEFYSNGQMKSMGNLKDGNQNGKWTSWFKNAQKQSEGEYIDGLEVGDWVWWAENGQKIFEGNHKDGKAFAIKFKADEEDAKKVEELKTEKLLTKLDDEINSIILTTENNPQDLFVEERLEIISAECVFGMNIFRDFFATVRDIAGGRSSATQKVLRDARKMCLAELKIEAHSVGADAVIGVDLDYSEFSGGMKSMLFLVASGTAVKLMKE